MGIGSNLRLTLAKNGTVGIGNVVTPLAALDIRNNATNGTVAGTTAIASVSGNTSFAGLVVDNSGVGDLFTASSSGLSRFTITQNGNVGIGTATPVQPLQVNGNVYLSNGGNLFTNVVANPTSNANAQISLATTGTTISRNVADSNAALTVQRSTPPAQVTF